MACAVEQEINAARHRQRHRSRSRKRCAIEIECGHGLRGCIAYHKDRPSRLVANIDIRNLTDAQLKALAEDGGVIGMIYFPTFIDTENPTLERLLDHIDHIASVAGVETVGLGSDFDGGGTLLADATEVPRITEGLLARGYSESEVRKILGGNTFRVLKESIG